MLMNIKFDLTDRNLQPSSCVKKLKFPKNSIIHIIDIIEQNYSLKESCCDHGCKFDLINKSLPPSSYVQKLRFPENLITNVQNYFLKLL